MRKSSIFNKEVALVCVHVWHLISSEVMVSVCMNTDPVYTGVPIDYC